MLQLNKWSLQISGTMMLSGALMLLVLPLQWVAAVLAAALWHELCHIFAVRLCGGSVHSMNVGDSGTVLECRAMTAGKELICVLAGPLGSILLLCLVTWFPRLALCGCFHGLYNLIPVYPLDGGRALRTASYAIFRQKGADTICLVVERTAFVLLCCIALYGAFELKMGTAPLLLAAILLFRMKREKLLANCRNRGYNRSTIVKR